jgi:hypothetical protein
VSRSIVDGTRPLLLDPGSVVAGEARGRLIVEGEVNYDGCAAFLIVGPFSGTVELTGGFILIYRNVYTAEQAEELLRERARALETDPSCRIPSPVFRILPDA